MPATAAWPDAGLLQTLILDGNAIDDVEPTAFALLDALQSLYALPTPPVLKATLPDMRALSCCRSLSNTGLTSLDGVEFPPALTTL